MVVAPELLSGLNAKQLRELARDLIAQIANRDKQITGLDQSILSKDREILYRQAKIDQLTHEMAVLKRWKFGRSREQLDAGQASLLDETIDADIAAIEQELQDLAPPANAAKESRQSPKRAALPLDLPRIDLHHEPDSTTCSCGCQLKRIGEDISEKLDYTPGVLTVQRHVRGKWACSECQTLTQAPVPAQIIDKGLPTSGLLAQVLVAKYSDHLPLYRQEAIFGRSGYPIARSTLAQWVGVCGVQLQPLVDALKSAMLQCAVLHAAQQALSYIGQLYEVEREVKPLSADERGRIRQTKSKPLADALHQWMVLQRQRVTDGTATAKALDYSLKRWVALTRFVQDGRLPIDNNWIENQIRPIAIGRNNWLFAGSLRAGQRAAAVMSLIQSAKLNGHDPYDYLKDVLARLPTQKNSCIDELLPHRWTPTTQ